jgi:ABC-type branched-subunit amino acid transport system ATPase component
MTLEQMGKAVAEAIAAGDLRRLEWAAQAAGTYQALVAAAVAAGVDRDELEEALASI